MCRVRVLSKISFPALCFVLISLLLPGCFPPRTKAPPLSVYEKSNRLRASLTDLPVPLGAQVVELDLLEDRGEVGVEKGFSFETTLSPDELACFYHEEMETAGWVKAFVVSRIAGQFVMLFTKPKKRLIVIADSLRKGQRVRLFYKSD